VKREVLSTFDDFNEIEPSNRLSTSLAKLTHALFLVSRSLAMASVLGSPFLIFPCAMMKSPLPRHALCLLLAFLLPATPPPRRSGSLRLLPLQKHLVRITWHIAASPLPPPRSIAQAPFPSLVVALEAARAKDMKGRLARVERLQKAMDAAARHGLTPAEVASLIDTCVNLTGDDNFHAVQGGLHALSVGDHFKIHINVLVPVAVERLGDGSSSSSLNCISRLRNLVYFLNDIAVLFVSQVSSPTIIVERTGKYA
jgi:hypothetical protein